MSPLELAVVQRKLSHLAELLELLRGESTTPLTAYLQDRRQQLLVERLLHLSVEAASDLLEHLLVQERSIKPQTYAETFLLAGQHSLIPMELGQRLIPAAGLRNRLVHDYEAIDPSRVHAAIPLALQDLTELHQALTARVRI